MPSIASIPLRRPGPVNWETHIARQRVAFKGETTGEIAAFARELRAHSIQPVLDGETRGGEILDVVGTGGDRLSTFTSRRRWRWSPRRRGCGWPSTATAPAPRPSAARM